MSVQALDRIINEFDLVPLTVKKHTPGGHDHDQMSHGRRSGSGGGTAVVDRPPPREVFNVLNNPHAWERWGTWLGVEAIRNAAAELTGGPKWDAGSRYNSRVPNASHEGEPWVEPTAKGMLMALDQGLAGKYLKGFVWHGAGERHLYRGVKPSTNPETVEFYQRAETLKPGDKMAFALASFTPNFNVASEFTKTSWDDVPIDGSRIIITVQGPAKVLGLSDNPQAPYDPFELITGGTFTVVSNEIDTLGFREITLKQEETFSVSKADVWRIDPVLVGHQTDTPVIAELEKAANPIVGENWDDLVRFYEDFLTKRGRSIFARLLATTPGPDLTRRREVEALFRTAYSRAGRATSVSLGNIYDFDPGDIRVAEWAAEQAGNLIADINLEQDGLLKQTLAQGVRDGMSQEQIRRRIASFMGLDRQQTQALQNFYNVQRSQGVPNHVVEQKAQELSQRMLNVRAERIARTEVVRAMESAQLAYLKQAADAGVIKRGDVWRVWSTHPDERTCEYCKPMDGKRARIGGQFKSSALGAVPHPPLHVNCRCWTTVDGPGVYLGPGGEMVSKNSLLNEIDALLEKHGTHDQKSHGNWARGMGGGSGGGGRRKKLRDEFAGKPRSSEQPIPGSPRSSAAIAHERVKEGIRDIFGPKAPTKMTLEQMQECVRFLLKTEYDTSDKSFEEFFLSTQDQIAYSEVKPDGTVVKQGTDSLGQRIKDGKLTAEAKAMHRSVVKDMEAEQGGKFKADKQVVIMAGLPGAGKTFLLNNFLAERFSSEGMEIGLGKGSFLHMNADDVKGFLINGGHVKAEGLHGMELSSHAHEESSYLFKSWRDDHISRGTNMVLDITAMNSYKMTSTDLDDNGQIIGLIPRLKAEGYTVHIVHADADPAETQASTMLRSHNKGQRGGRPINFKQVSEMAAKDPYKDPVDNAFPSYREAANGMSFHYKTSPFLSSVMMDVYGMDTGVKPKEMP